MSADDAGSSRKRPRDAPSGISREAELSLEVRSLRSRLSESEFKLRLELERCQLALDEEGNLRESLERKLNFLATEERRLREDLRSKASEVLALKSGLNSEIQTLKRQHEEALEEKAELAHKVSTLEAESQRGQVQMSNMEDLNATEVRKLQERNMLLEAQLLSVQDSAPEAKPDGGELPVASGDLKEVRLARMRASEMERTVRKLRRELETRKQQSQSQGALEEEVRSLKGSLMREKELRERLEETLASDRADREAFQDLTGRLQSELASAEGIFGLEASEKDGKTPQTVARIVAVLRKASGERCTHVSRIADAERKSSMAALELEGTTAKLRILTEENVKLERRASALGDTIRERERQISYFSTQATQREAAIDAIFERIHSKEETILSDARLQELRRDLANSEAERTRLTERASTLESRLEAALAGKKSMDSAKDAESANLRQTLSEAQLEVNTLREELVELRARPGQKDEIPKDEHRMIHAKENPYVMALREKLGTQKQEIDRLSEELKTLAETSKAQAGSGESFDAAKLRQRLKSMFAERVKVLREAVYLLTGWKIDMATDREHPQLRLRSLYAEKEEDSLLFAWKSPSADHDTGSRSRVDTDPELQLLETPFALRVGSQAFVYLERYHSVPAFLAHVTMELAEKQTLM